MAIDLLNSFLKKGQNVSTNTKTLTTESGQTLPQNLQVMRAIRSLQAGQTLRGEIISVKGEDVQLAILKDVIIDAKLSQSMNLSPGISMPFQVKANNQNGLSLIPLFTNTAVDPNAMKALDMAGLPLNDRSMEMVLNLMERGMPIDKNSLQETYRDVAMYKEFPVKDVISLRQLQLPVSAENLEQLSSYEKNQHFLNDTFMEMGQAIGEQVKELISQGRVGDARNFLMQVQQLFQTEQGKMAETNKLMMLQESSFLGNQEGAQGVAQEGMLEKTVSYQKSILEESANLEIASKADGTVILKDKEQTVTENGIIQPEKHQNSNANKEILSAQKETLWNELYKELDNGKEAGKLTRLFDKIWKNEVSNEWKLEPETLLDKKQVKEYYDKLESSVKQLEKIINETMSVKSPAAKVVHNTASNLDFMNQLHQMHGYIQLPLKMSGKNAHGELYVFSNKKNLTKQEGKVTALLHLDMEHLGKMDVYVALEDKKVSTNFYLEKEEYLDFLEANMDMLNSRLQKRGYECSIKTSLRNTEEESVMNIIEKQQGQSVLLSTQAFDVRA